MKKATALTLAGLMAAGAAHASWSRFAGFGVASQFIDDVTLVWNLPSELVDNTDSTYFEFGNIKGVKPAASSSTGFTGYAVTGNAWGGSNMTMGPGVFGLWYNRPVMGNSFNEDMDTVSMAGGYVTDAFVQPTAGVNATILSQSFLTPANMVDVLYAFNMGGAALGIGVNYATASNKVEVVSSAGTANVTQSSSQLGVSLGGGFKDMGGMHALDAGLIFNMNSAVISGQDPSGAFFGAGTAVDDNVTDSIMDIKFNVKTDLGEKGKGDIITLGVESTSGDDKANPKTAAPANSYTEAKFNYLNTNLGWAMSKSSDKGMGLGGLIFGWNSQGRQQPNLNGANVTDTLTSSTISLKAVSAGEAKVKDWLTLRMAISGNLYYSNSTKLDQSTSSSTVVGTTTSSTPPAPATITIGDSITVGDIVIDGVMNQDMLFTGPYLVSGLPNGLNTMVSATWGWGGTKE